MLWLAEQGYQVVGVELSEIAAKDFFAENGLTADVTDQSINGSQFLLYQCHQCAISIWVGDFFKFETDVFDALYDRAALIALPESMRPAYLAHCQALLKNGSNGLIITVVYDQTLASGPPFSVQPEELTSLWSGPLVKAGEIELIEQEPRWKSKGLTSFKEQFWRW
ncbi:hypothetical protein GCM10007876_27550 [Litoribrevibacter albus]|uniref:Thiopurine S-methyltransferase n=2 Tax=Litoribrevibacter albus TaxID=1473156 RepID=A0AA37W944_9GAMM|nr:hypothetical protein GCM10007876_27550 [Litoribrevibacter albus]